LEALVVVQKCLLEAVIKMNNLERNIMESFSKVKDDMKTIQRDILVLTQNQEKIIEWMTDARDREVQLYNKLKDLRESIQKKTKPSRKKKK